MKFSGRLRLLREQSHMGQKELALKLGFSIGTISNYEKEVHSPNLDTLCRIADCFDVTTDYLLGRTDCKDSLNPLEQHITDTYTLQDFIQLLKQLSDKPRQHLVYELRLLELARKKNL